MDDAPWFFLFLFSHSLQSSLMKGMSIHVSSLASEFHAPFFILHGSADKITDPNLSQSFHDESPSKDKTIKIYDGLWHNLTGAESDEDTEMLFDDMWEWISKRS